jgi:very-short-patch-repair endonuclease
MKLRYRKNLVSYARKLRQAGNLSEVLLWGELNKNKLGCRFLRQRPISGYIVDFYCPSLNLAIEIDGAASHDCRVKKDKDRQKEIESLGIRVIRFADKDVRYNLAGVMQSIRSKILRPAEPGHLL